MLLQPNSGKLIQIILIVLVLGMTSACESEVDGQTKLKNSEIKVLKSEQRAVAAETRMKEMASKLEDAEKARQAAERELDGAKAEAAFHSTLNVIFFGLIIAAFFSGLRRGEDRKKDNDAIRKSLSDDPYIEMYTQAANTGSYKPRSARS